ncbi:MAG: hypothetical protein NVSMB5_27050 [Candidatus Velthaea sp.]
MFDGPARPGRRTALPNDPRGSFSRRVPNVAILAGDLRVEMHGSTDIFAANGVQVSLGNPIGEPLHALVTGAVADWRDRLEDATPFVAMPWNNVVLRVYPLASVAGLKIGMAAERFRARTNLSLARHAYALSPRESEIIEFILRGYATPLIATHMNIAESTAADHIKRLLDKTHSSNRAELVAKLLGWRSSEETAPDF